jgi:hypothetical protein
MEWEALSALVQVVQILGNALLVLYVWASNRRRVTVERISAMESDMDERFHKTELRLTHIDDAVARLPKDNCGVCQQRVTRLEEALKHSIGPADIVRLHERIDRSVAEIQGLKGQVTAVAGTLGVIHDYLLNHGGKHAP